MTSAKRAQTPAPKEKRSPVSHQEVSSAQAPHLVGMRCKACDKPFRGVLEINPMTSSFSYSQCPFCQGSSILLGEGRSLTEDRAMRLASGPIEHRAAMWLADGEQGSSSLAIHAYMTGRAGEDEQAPLDCDDLRRCILLLDRIPEWVPAMPAMAFLPRWRGIAPAWSELSEMFLEECPDLRGRAPRTRDFLERLMM